MRRSLPEPLLTRAKEYAGGLHVPVEPEDAATVLLLRDGSAGLEVFVMVRRTSMAFAGGMVAFPGGKVEPFDTAEIADDIPGRLGAPTEQAAAVVGAAVRETREETGIRLEVSGLGLWDAWTTPIFEPRRYRTWFFTAELPAGQQAEELSTESSAVEWVTAAEALARVHNRAWAMFPPTQLAFVRLAAFDDVASVMAETRTAAVEMFTPTFDGVDSLTLPRWAQAL